MRFLTMFATTFLAGCASQPTILYKDRIVEVPLPVRAPIDPRLVTDCEPRYDLPPSGSLLVGDALKRLAAVEEALTLCRSRLEQLRKL